MFCSLSCGTISHVSFDFEDSISSFMAFFQSSLSGRDKASVTVRGSGFSLGNFSVATYLSSGTPLFDLLERLTAAGSASGIRPAGTYSLSSSLRILSAEIKSYVFEPSSLPSVDSLELLTLS